jgi:hypothetical protein
VLAQRMPMLLLFNRSSDQDKPFIYVPRLLIDNEVDSEIS